MFGNLKWVACVGVTLASMAVCHAEVVQCIANADDTNPNNILRVTVQPTHSVGAPLSMMTARAESRGLRIYEDTPVKRIKKGGYLYYREMPSLTGFELAIKSKQVSGSGLDAVLSLDPGQVYGQKISGLKCTITGDAFPPVAPCPAAKALNAALIDASKYGSPERIQEILECGADANGRDALGCSALLYVTDLDCGYASRVTNGEAPRMSSRGSLEITDLMSVLLDYGAQVDIRDKVSGETPLINSVKFRQLSAVEMLLELEADVDAKDASGDTSLIWAASQGDELMIRTLLNSNPDMNWKDKAGDTAYSVAQRLGYVEILDLLVPVSASLTVEGKADGSCTPLSLKLKKGERTRITLKSPAGKMFRIESPILGLDLMAMSGDKAQQVVTPVVAGTFAFTCGLHGAPADQQSKGSIIVTEMN